MPDPSIHFTIPALTPLVTDTALAKCTTTTWVEGEWLVERRWPGLSTGEEILWEILAHLAKRDPLPEGLRNRAYMHLDDENRQTVVDVLLAVGDELARDNAEQLAFESARDARAG